MTTPAAAALSTSPKLATFDAVRLHARLRYRFAGIRITPPECKAEPCALADEHMVVDGDPYVRPLRLASSAAIVLCNNRPVAGCFMPKVGRPYATRDQIVSVFMPS